MAIKRELVQAFASLVKENMTMNEFSLRMTLRMVGLQKDIPPRDIEDTIKFVLDGKY